MHTEEKMQSNAINELNQPQLTFATPTLAGTKLYPDCLMISSSAEKAKGPKLTLSPQRHPQLHSQLLTDDLSALKGQV